MRTLWGGKKYPLLLARPPFFLCLLAAVINANEIAVLNTIGESKEKM